jgi:hypothetical protein
MSSLLLLCSSLAFAEEPTATIDHHDPAIGLSVQINLRLDDLRYHAPTFDFVDSVTMTHVPSGSMVIRFDGLHGVAMRQLRSQYRRFARQAARAGWYVPESDSDVDRRFYTRLDHAWVDPHVNGAWWNRRWWESASPSRGGAPLLPYIHTYGREMSWRRGPLTFTNTLKLRVDYLAFFEIDPDPVLHDHPEWSPPVTFDVRPLRETMVGTSFQFDVRPRLHMSMPQSGDPLSFFRGVSCQFSFEIWQRRTKVVKGDVEVKWRPDDGLAATVEVDLVSW